MDELWGAIAAGDEDAVRELVEARPELVGERNDEGLSPLLHALYNGHPELVEPILDANPPLDVFDSAAVGRTRGLEELLDAEPELARSWSQDGFTPLHLAAFFGREGAAKLLLEYGADTGAVARHATLQVMPLHSAAAGGHGAVVRLLLEAGADPNATQPGGFTPLHAAAANGDRASAEALLAAGADRTARTDDGKTPAELAEPGFRETLPDL